MRLNLECRVYAHSHSQQTSFPRDAVSLESHASASRIVYTDRLLHDTRGLRANHSTSGDLGYFKYHVLLLTVQGRVCAVLQADS